MAGGTATALFLVYLALGLDKPAAPPALGYMMMYAILCAVPLLGGAAALFASAAILSVRGLGGGNRRSLTNALCAMVLLVAFAGIIFIVLDRLRLLGH
jgi:energy-converting hydrogenase Eha subunit H